MVDSNVIAQNKIENKAFLKSKQFLIWICNYDSPLSFYDNLIWSNLTIRSSTQSDIADLTGLNRTRTVSRALEHLSALDMIMERKGRWRSGEPKGDQLNWFQRRHTKKSGWWNTFQYFPIYKSTEGLSVRQNALRWAMYAFAKKSRKSDWYGSVIKSSPKHVRRWHSELCEMGLADQQWNSTFQKAELLAVDLKADRNLWIYKVEWQPNLIGSASQTIWLIEQFNDAVRRSPKLAFSRGQVRAYWSGLQPIFEDKPLVLLEALVQSLPILYRTVELEAKSGALLHYKTKRLVSFLQRSWETNPEQFRRGLWSLPSDALAYA